MAKEQPKIEYKEKTYHQVGCRKCGKGDDWNIYSDGRILVAQCKCGHTLVIPEGITQRKPDSPELIMGLRMVI